MAQQIYSVPDNTQDREDEVLLATIKPSLLQTWTSWVIGFAAIVVCSVLIRSVFGSFSHLVLLLQYWLPINASPAVLQPLLLTTLLIGAFWRPGKATWHLATSSYEVTTRRILYTWGILNRRHDQIEMARIRDIRVTQPLHLRLLRQGNVEIATVDRQFQNLTISGLHEPVKLKNLIHNTNVRERARLGYREIEASQYFR